MSRMRKRFLDCSGMTIEEAESFGRGLVEQQRDVMFQLGDLARYCEARWPDTWHQVIPEYASPGMIARAAGVARAYPKESDRTTDATYTQYMQAAGKPDRLKVLESFIDRGLTSDEARRADASERKDASHPRWMAAFDVHYHTHRYWFSGAGVEAAAQVAGWVDRTTTRLKDKGLTDVLCCFDSPRNFRKELTSDWEDKYKGNRGPKEPELVQQLTLVRELLEGNGFCCVALDGFEADDVMASAASQFDGRVTLVTQDKDLKQCLSDRCNILLDVKWQEDELSCTSIPEYKWLSAKQHTEETGVSPDRWPSYQAIAGDSVDGIKGVAGIGTKGAADLIQRFGSVTVAIQAAKDGDERIRPKQRKALIDFEPLFDITWQLVTLRTDLELPTNTRI